MTSYAPLTDDNAHIAALCSMMELFLQHGLNPTAPRHAFRLLLLCTPALHDIPRLSDLTGHILDTRFCFPVHY